MVTVTKAMIDEVRTKKGAFSKQQISIGGELTGCTKGWLKSLIGKDVPADKWALFCKGREQYSAKAKRKAAREIINKVSPNNGKDWSWTPTKGDIPQPKTAAIKGGKMKQKRLKLSKAQHVEFFTSDEWRKLRVRVLEKYGCSCMMCGRSPMQHRIVIHVDHIKPRSKYPELALEYSNLQLLCEDCNIGKGNRYETDWRPDQSEMAELEIVAVAMERI